jgi:septum formation protein
MLYLASQSPRRRDLLAQLGVEFGLLDVDVPEQRLPGEPPDAYVSRVAREKAGAGLLAVVANPAAVVLGDRVFGKPADADDAARMLRDLSGRSHRVVSTVWLVSGGREASATSVSEVRVEPLDEAMIARYLGTGECFGKAGAYAIQGRFGAHVAHLAGSYTGVMGLPLHETARLLRGFGLIDREPGSA